MTRKSGKDRLPREIPGSDMAQTVAGAPPRPGRISRPIGFLSTGMHVVNPLVALIRSEPGMAERLLVEHADDGSGRCKVCTAGAQTLHYRWPCTTQLAAAEAATAGGVGGATVIGAGR
jgi:hypothetical protein